MAGLEHGRRDLAPQVAPGRLAVQHHHRRAGAEVDVREPQPVPLTEARRPVEALEPVEQHVGRPDGVGHFAPSRSSNGSSTFASREAVTRMVRSERDQAITLSTCSRSRTYWNASACSSEAYSRETRNVQPPSSARGDPQRRRLRDRAHLGGHVERDRRRLGPQPHARRRRSSDVSTASAGELAQIALRRAVEQHAAGGVVGGLQRGQPRQPVGVRARQPHDLDRRAELPVVVRGVVAEGRQPRVGLRVAQRRRVEVELGVGAAARRRSARARPPGCPIPMW